MTSRPIDLTTDLGNGLILSNPVMTASGTFGYGIEYADLVDLDRIGGIIVKGTTLEPRQGNAYPRMAETPAGMLNAVGLQNKGVDYLISTILPQIENLKTSIIVNVSGAKAEDYAEVCSRLADTFVPAVEINISCPNVKHGGMAFGTTPDGAAAITRACRQAFPRHLMVKLSPNVTSIADIAKAVEGEGADSVSLINTLLGMSIDVRRRMARLSTVTGGLSGPAVMPVALRMVWQVAHAVRIPVVGLGGISSTDDALQFIMAGAKAVEIGTANFVNPRITTDIVDGLQDYCKENNLTSLQSVTGII